MILPQNYAGITEYIMELSICLSIFCIGCLFFVLVLHIYGDPHQKGHLMSLWKSNEGLLLSCKINKQVWQHAIIFNDIFLQHMLFQWHAHIFFKGNCLMQFKWVHRRKTGSLCIPDGLCNNHSHSILTLVVKISYNIFHGSQILIDIIWYISWKSAFDWHIVGSWIKLS